MASKSFRWGRYIAHSNFEEFGELGNAKSDKAYSTCMKYAYNKKVKTTDKGVVLTNQLRQKYKDMADGILAGYVDITSGRHYNKRK